MICHAGSSNHIAGDLSCHDAHATALWCDFHTADHFNVIAYANTLGLVMPMHDLYASTKASWLVQITARRLLGTHSTSINADITVTSWAQWRLKSPASSFFYQSTRCESFYSGLNFWGSSSLSYSNPIAGDFDQPAAGTALHFDIKRTKTYKST